MSTSWVMLVQAAANGLAMGGLYILIALGITLIALGITLLLSIMPEGALLRGISPNLMSALAMMIACGPGGSRKWYGLPYRRCNHFYRPLADCGGDHYAQTSRAVRS